MNSRKLLTAAVAAFVAALGVFYVQVPPNPDQAIFDYAGWVGAHGGRYYLDAAEQNFPGGMILHEAAHRLFGTHLWTIRAFDFLLLVAGAAAMASLLRRSGLRTAAAVAVPLYVAEYVASGQWMAGQRDLTGANVLLVGAYAYVRRISGGSRAWLVPAAACVLFATLLRPTYLAFGVVPIAADFATRRSTGRRIGAVLGDAVAAIGLVAVLAGALAAWGAHVGSLAAWHEQAILFNLRVYSGTATAWAILLGGSGLLARFSVLLAASALGIWLARRSDEARTAIVVLVGLLGTAVVSTLVQGKGYGYHLGALIPAVAGLGALAVDRVAAAWRDGGRTRGAAAALVALTAAMTVSTAWHGRMLGPQVRRTLGLTGRDEMLRRATTGIEGCNWHDLERAADWARATVPEDGTVLVWSRLVSINVLAGRRSPTRFITYGMLILAREPFELAGAWRDEFRRSLEEHPPGAVFTTGPGDADEHAGLWDGPDDGSPPALLRATLRDRYEKAATFGSLEAWILKRP